MCKPTTAGKNQLNTCKPATAGKDRLNNKCKPATAGKNQLNTCKPATAGKDQLNKCKPATAGKDRLNNKCKPSTAGKDRLNNTSRKPATAGKDQLNTCKPATAGKDRLNNTSCKPATAASPNVKILHRMEYFITSQNTSFAHTEFLLLGFPGITTNRHLLAIPLLFVYGFILIINSAIIYRIWAESSLQSHMYLLISLLLFVNVFCTTTIIPKFLLSLAFGLNQISLTGCLVQMFFIYATLMFESNVVLLMALDRYVAICRPLRYHDIVTKKLLIQLTLLSMARSVSVVTPIIILNSRVQFCRSNVILNFTCENMGLLKLGCGDISKTHIIGLIIRIFITVIDGSLILLSYLNILHTAMFVIGKSPNKAWYTCSTHVSVAILIYSCNLLSAIIYRSEMAVSVDGQNLTSAIYYLFPAIVNPVIYGLRVKEIRLCLEKAYGWKKKETVGHREMN
ncbi:olfactory receptor 52K1-like [Rhinophrynus dorsalis]